MFRCHVLAVPHAVSVPEYSTCAFTQKVVKLCKMLKMRGHYVIHYGHEDSRVEADETVTVTTNADLEKSYPGWDWRKHSFPSFRWEDHAYQAFYAHSIAEIQRRKRPGDFLLCTFGGGHKAVADAHKDMIVVEPGIGYPSGSFAQFRVVESYAVMHAYQGQPKIERACNDFWYDAVIPNYFDLADFKFSEYKQNYFLLLGRINDGKGAHIAQQIADATNTEIIMAGHYAGGNAGLQASKNVKLVGIVDPHKRKQLLTRARAVLCPSTFMEPFCGTQIEAMLSGTPVISSDWGAFAEYNVHGVTGYRCKTFEQFVWAANNITNIKPIDCRTWAERFSLERIGPMFDEYFESVAAVADGRGWYAPKPGRVSLDNTTFNARMGLEQPPPASPVLLREPPVVPPAGAIPIPIGGMTTTPPPPGVKVVPVTLEDLQTLQPSAGPPTR